MILISTRLEIVDETGKMQISYSYPIMTTVLISLSVTGVETITDADEKSGEKLTE